MWPSLGMNLRLGSLPKMALATVALIAVEQIVTMLVAWGASVIGLDSSSLEGVFEDGVFGDPVARATVFITAVVLAPLFEEIFFRGLLFPSLRHRFGLGAAAVLSSFLFAVLHPYSLPGLAAIFLGALASCYAYEKTRSLWPSILAHAANNLMAYLGMIYLYGA